MQHDNDGDDDVAEVPSKRETLSHLLPRVVLQQGAIYTEELGPVRDVAIRGSHVAVIFDRGELQFHGDANLWSRLLAKVHSGELVISGDAKDEAWNTLAAEVARRRASQLGT